MPDCQKNEAYVFSFCKKNEKIQHRLCMFIKLSDNVTACISRSLNAIELY